MRVRCLGNSGKELKGPYSIYGTSKTAFSLTVGREYRVYAMMISECLSYLVLEDHGQPGWSPAILFEVTDDKVPLSWHFAHLARRRLVVVVGFEEIVKDESFRSSLSEGSHEALKTFFSKKKGMDTEGYFHVVRFRGKPLLSAESSGVTYALSLGDAVEAIHELTLTNLAIVSAQTLEETSGTVHYGEYWECRKDLGEGPENYAQRSRQEVLGFISHIERNLSRDAHIVLEHSSLTDYF